MQNVYVVDAVRTPVVKAKGVFKNERPDDLLAFCLKGLLGRVPRISAEMISDVVIGCAMPEGAQGMNIARIASLLAGFPDSVPGMTINRFCASGLQAVATAASNIALGQADFMIAGGVESMSSVPLGGFSFSANPQFFDSQEFVGMAYGMGITAEKVAERWQVSREAQDSYAVRSHDRAIAAIERGEFNQEILPYSVHGHEAHLKTGEIQDKLLAISKDNGPRASELSALARLSPVFALKGSVTAGNTSQVSDGAAAVLLASEQAVRDYDLHPLARFCGYAVAGVAPEVMGIGPIEAIPRCLAQAGLSLHQVDWIELNEAFAAQTLAVIGQLGLDESKVNPLGGAIALGHPLGATGAIRTATVCHALKRHRLRYGMVTMCIGTGMGAAGLFEAV